MIKNNRYDYTKIKKFERGQIMGLTKRLARHRFNSNWAERGHTNNLVYKDAESLGLEVQYSYADVTGETFHFKTFRKITKEQSDFGKVWLKDFFFKKDGQPRHGKRTQYISDHVLKIAKKVSRFEFIGVFGGFNGMGELCDFIPIYRAYNHKGEWFDYAPVHWGQPIICDESTNYERNVS